MRSCRWRLKLIILFSHYNSCFICSLSQPNLCIIYGLTITAILINGAFYTRGFSFIIFVRFFFIRFALSRHLWRLHSVGLGLVRFYRLIHISYNSIAWIHTAHTFINSVIPVLYYILWLAVAVLVLQTLLAQAKTPSCINRDWVPGCGATVCLAREKYPMITTIVLHVVFFSFAVSLFIFIRLLLLFALLWSHV